MGLTEDRQAELRKQLEESKIPYRYFNQPLSKQGEPGKVLRHYIKGEYAEDAQSFRGAIIIANKPGIAQSFARDIVIAGASTEFYYLQTFANRIGLDEALPKSYCIEWFEQEAESPFSSKERFELETHITRLLDQEVLFYLFTPIPPQASKWWSRQFIDTLLQYCSTIETDKNGNRQRSQGTSVRIDPVQGSKNPRRAKRITVR